jgi:hypothetical protein
MIDAQTGKPSLAWALFTRAELKTGKRKPGEKRSDATGTKHERGFVKITGSSRETRPDLCSKGCAPWRESNARPTA